MGNVRNLRDRVARLFALALTARTDGRIGVSDMLIAAALRVDDEANALEARASAVPNSSNPAASPGSS